MNDYIPPDPCRPSPCGMNSRCSVLNNRALCTCLPEYLGSPPNCRPECLISSECPFDKACINKKCVDPCPGTCGYNARCRVTNHSPICSCLNGYVGDPFSNCQIEKSMLIVCWPTHGWVFIWILRNRKICCIFKITYPLNTHLRCWLI